jgi:hypothetical protein
MVIKASFFVKVCCVTLMMLLVLSAITPVPASSQAATQAATVQGTVQGTQQAQSQGNTCQQYVKAALEATNKGCANTERNQVCYGNISIKAEPQTGVTDFTFEQPGQIVPVTSIQRLQLGVLNPNNNTWGVALFRIQADLPDTAPGQNVTLLAFGDVDLQNTGQATTTTLDVMTSDRATIRPLPTNFAPLVGILPKNVTITATGRTADASWLHIKMPTDSSKQAWLLASTVTTSGDLTTLSVLDPSKPIYGPMQAFYLRTGVGEAACKGAPPDGILIQSPKQTARVTLSINDVKITVGSTLYLHTQSGDAKASSTLAVSTLEGSATVEVAGARQVVRPGYQVEVPLDTNLKASGPPGQVHPADASVLQTLPGQYMPVPVSYTASSSGSRPPVSGTPRAATGGGSFVCPSGAVASYDTTGQVFGTHHVVTGCICANGTHAMNRSQPPYYTWIGQVCN